MLRSIVLCAVALLLSFPALAEACRCTSPPPLSECVVDDGEAALLVTIKCLKTVACNINDGVAVADVTIEQVFQDNTELGLEEGVMTTITSQLQSSICGIGASFSPGDQWIMFARPTSAPQRGLGVSRRLQDVSAPPEPVAAPVVKLGSPGAVNTPAPPGSDGSNSMDGVFSDGSVCDVMGAELRTASCFHSIRQPSMAQIEELSEGCASVPKDVPVTTIAIE